MNLQRLKDWDYSIPWWYYITICTKGMKCFFGEIKDGNMVYNSLGEKTKEFFFEIPLHFPVTDIDDFIVMPNHVHGIIIINDKVETAVETRYSVSLQSVSLQTKFGKPQKNSLSTIMNNYKGAVNPVCW